MATNPAHGFCFRHVVKESSGKGRGVFADEPIKKGDIVWRHVPGQYVVYDQASFKTFMESLSHDEAVYGLTHMFGLKDLPGCVLRVLDDGVLINHADNPNLRTNNAGPFEITRD